VQRKEFELTTYRSGTVGGGTNIQSKLVFSNMNRNPRLGLRSRSPCAGVATGLLKTPRIQLKNRQNDTALIPVLNTFKITTFPLLEHRSNMTEYLFCNCIIYPNAKKRQSTCSKQLASCL